MITDQHSTSQQVLKRMFFTLGEHLYVGNLGLNKK